MLTIHLKFLTPQHRRWIELFYSFTSLCPLNYYNKLVLLELLTMLYKQHLHEGNKSENELLGLHQDQKLLHSKGNSQQNKGATHGMGEDICK